MKTAKLQSFRTQMLNHKLCCLFIAIRKEGSNYKNDTKQKPAKKNQQAVWGVLLEFVIPALKGFHFVMKMQLSMVAWFLSILESWVCWPAPL